jgi:hypothetical protein
MIMNCERPALYSTWARARFEQMKLGVAPPTDPSSSESLGPAALPQSVARPDLAGRRLQVPGKSMIYLVDPEGYRRRVPSDFVYDRIFREHCAVVDCADIERIAKGAPLAKDTMLVRALESEDLFLVDLGRRRAITRAAVMQKYGFAWGRVFAVRQALVDSIPRGETWE